MFILNTLHKYLVQTKKRTNTLNTNPIGFNYITKRYNRPKILQCYFDYQSIKIRKKQNIFKVKYRLFGKRYKYIILDLYQITNFFTGGENPHRNYRIDSITYLNYQLDINDPICKLCRNFDVSINYEITFEISIYNEFVQRYYNYEFNKYEIMIEYNKNKLHCIQIYDKEYDLPIVKIAKKQHFFD
jgi:hypothetical protein